MAGSQLTSFQGAQTHLLLPLSNRKDMPAISRLASFPPLSLTLTWRGHGQEVVTPAGTCVHSPVSFEHTPGSLLTQETQRSRKHESFTQRETVASEEVG